MPHRGCNSPLSDCTACAAAEIAHIVPVHQAWRLKKLCWGCEIPHSAFASHVEDTVSHMKDATAHVEVATFHMDDAASHSVTVAFHMMYV